MGNKLRHLPGKCDEEVGYRNDDVQFYVPKGNAEPIKHGIKQQEGKWQPSDGVRHCVADVVVVELVSEEEVHEFDRLLTDGQIIVPGEEIADGVDDGK